MPSICIVIPCFNEEHRLPLKEFSTFIEKEFITFCFVNDGSTDNTTSVLTYLQKKFPERVIVLNLEKNIGKAAAVRAAILKNANNFDLIGYFDADLATPLLEIFNLTNEIEKNNKVMMAIGSRVKILGKTIERKIFRHYLGRFFATVASTILSIAIYDTQCGAKILRKEFALSVFKEPFISNWLFDVEIFARSISIHGRKETEKTIIEVPLNYWKDISGSKIKFKHFIMLPIEFIKIYLKYRK